MMTPIVALTLALLAAPAPPPTADAAALIRDLSTLVLAAEQRLWHIDHYEIESLIPDALQCVCRAEPEVRAGARQWLDAEAQRLGGPPREAWTRAERDLDAISDLLTTHRIRLVLDATNAVAAARCPFWTEPAAPYRERHRATDRSTFNFDGGGLFSVTNPRDGLRVGGGGSGRLTVAHGFGPHWSIRFGAEIGGAGLVNESLETEEIEVTMFGTLMTSVRRRFRLLLFDLEAGPLALGIPWRDPLRYGVRVGTIIGMTYPRIARVQPWAGVRIALDYLPAQDGEGTQLAWRSGFRVGFDLYPSD